MSDAFARPSMTGKSAVSLLVIAAFVSAAASPADARRIRFIPGLGSLSSGSNKPTSETPSAQASAQSTGGPASTTPASAPIATPSSGDERTQQILADEQRGANKLHPLQTSEPGYNIIVCEAGCGDSKAHIVYKRPAAAVRSASAESATPTSPVAKSVECRGGCDGGPANRTASITGAGPGLLNDAAGAWLTTTTPAAAPSVPTAAVTLPPAEAKSPAGKSSRDDWMARINRERAAAVKSEAAPATIPETVSPSPSEITVHEPGAVRESNPVRDDR